jgi:hypothetical protein
LENTPPPEGRKISAGIIGGENRKREREKGENVKENARKGKEKGRRGRKRENGK